VTRAVILTALVVLALTIFCVSNSEHAEQFPLVQADYRCGPPVIPIKPDTKPVLYPNLSRIV
jgi:hypothetical protein